MSNLQIACATVIGMSRAAMTSPYKVACDYAQSYPNQLGTCLTLHQRWFPKEPTDRDGLVNFLELVALVAREPVNDPVDVQDLWAAPGVLKGFWEPEVLSEQLESVYRWAWELRGIYVRQVNGYPSGLPHPAPAEDLQAKERDLQRMRRLEGELEHTCRILGFRTVYFQDDGGPSTRLEFERIDKPERHNFRHQLG